MKIYMVAFTGGDEEPEFKFFDDPDAAQAQRDEWENDMILDKGYMVDLLTYDTDTMTTSHGIPDEVVTKEES